MPSSSRRRRNRKRNLSVAPAAPPEARDWAALPRDILIDVFVRLGPCCEIMRGAELACTDWRRVAVGEPALWRRADLTAAEAHFSYKSRLAMARAAVDRSAGQCVARSAGQCVAFSGFLDADSLLYLVERASSLKSLYIPDADVTDEEFNVALKKLPLLEDLEISTAYYDTEVENLLESVCKACPYLKKLGLTLPEDPEAADSDGNMKIRDGGMCELPIMCELRSIKLFEFDLTADGLTAILVNCPVLESLHVSGYYIGNETDEELRAKCARVKDLSLPQFGVPIYDSDYDSDLDW